MAIGSPAPAFTLPGTDGRVHSLSDYAGSRVLAIVFTCNHCPVSQLYEARLAKLYEDYRNRGVALVAINPNSPKALRLDELSHTDVGESMDDMKTRAAYRHLEYPYLSDGETQTLAKQFGVVATPQIFVFDQARMLRYQGRIDNHAREDAVTSRDARNAIDALLGDRPVPVAQTTAVGCPPTFLSTSGGPEAEQAAIAAEPVTLEMVGADGLKKLRQNGTGKLLLINFWATWCAPCVSEFPDLEATYRMYRGRNVDFVSVSTNDPEEKPGVLEFLQKHTPPTGTCSSRRRTSTSYRRPSIRRCPLRCRSRSCSRQTARCCIRSSAHRTSRSCGEPFLRICLMTGPSPACRPTGLESNLTAEPNPTN